MKSVFIFPLRLLAYWLVFFAAFRVWFIVWFASEWLPGDPVSAWKSLWYALPLDISMAGYLIALPLFFWFAGLAIGERAQPFLSKATIIFNVCLICVMVFAFGANVFIYEDWHTPLNSRALKYLSTPYTLLDSMSLIFILGSTGLYIALTWLMWRAYKLVAGTNIFPENASRWQVLTLPVHTGLLFLAIRGGLGVIPISESAVYFSSHLFNNHAATNTAWNLIHSLIETRSTVNHYRFMDDKMAAVRTKSLLGDFCKDVDVKRDFFENSDSSYRPNIVFITLESHTAQIVEELGGEPGVCPNLSRLIHEGILFENIYGSGYRTDQGLVSVLGGYPAQPDQSILLLTDKAAKLNSLPKILHNYGYSTAFFYGGELTFANLGMWLTNERFEKILSENNFSREERIQRWGVDDHTLLQRALREIDQLQQPFFAAAMTLSLHPPYDVPYQSKWQGLDERDKFLNSAAFADYAVGEFFKMAEQQAWYDNTLFVLVADHGSGNPEKVGLDNPKSRHIPLIFFGKPLNKKWHNSKIPVFGNHHDIPATVLGMLGLHYSDLPWSRNLWRLNDLVNEHPTETNKRLEFAYFTNESGLGWANSQGRGFYAFGSGEWYIWDGQLDSTSRTDARAYLQTLYNDFLEK